MIGTEGNILATERFKGDDTQYYLYNKDIQGSTTSLVKEDGSAELIRRAETPKDYFATFDGLDIYPELEKNMNDAAEFIKAGR